MSDRAPLRAFPDCRWVRTQEFAFSRLAGGLIAEVSVAAGTTLLGWTAESAARFHAVYEAAFRARYRPAGEASPGSTSL